MSHRAETNEPYPAERLRDLIPPDTAGIDAGLTLTKVVRSTSSGIELTMRETAEATSAEIWTGANDEPAGRIGVTGARAGGFPDGKNVVRAQEIDAAAAGVRRLMATNGDSGEFVMALLGTGTAFAAVRGEKTTHLGGTPLGGGSFAGIARRIDGSLSYETMFAEANTGDRRAVDLMISDAYPGGIGRVGPDLTAAHLARQGRARRDVLAGLLNMHGENIGQIAASRALIARVSRVVLCGGFVHGNAALTKSIAAMAALFGVSVEVAPLPAYAGALGAALMAADA